MGVKKRVISKIETTKPKNSRSVSLKNYYTDLNRMSKDIEKYAISLCKENLLSVKIALMKAVSDVNKKIKEGKG